MAGLGVQELIIAAVFIGCGWFVYRIAQGDTKEQLPPKAITKKQSHQEKLRAAQIAAFLRGSSAPIHLTGEELADPRIRAVFNQGWVTGYAQWGNCTWEDLSSEQQSLYFQQQDHWNEVQAQQRAQQPQYYGGALMQHITQTRQNGGRR